MDGRAIARIVDSELASRGMSKAQFYEESGISSATLSQWRTGKYEPTADKLQKIEKCLKIDLSDYEKSDDTDELKEMLRDRQDLRILLHSAKDVPASSIYALISQIEKLKEDAN
jgi:transcriptional regulator with XRE-family HTH domain